MTVPTQAGHFYLPDGSPYYTCQAKDGSERATTLRDARKIGAYPSVTEILKVQAKPALNSWFQEQAIQAAWDVGMPEGLGETQFKEFVRKRSQEASEAARERGTALHGAIERYLLGQTYDLAFQPHINAVKAAMRSEGMDLLDGFPEKSFAYQEGDIAFGGKPDWFDASFLVDYKSKDIITEKTMVYDEHHLQLGAYDHGLRGPARKRFIVFVGVDDCQVKVCECDPDERYWELFKSLVRVWQHSKNYYPSKP